MRKSAVTLTVAALLGSSAPILSFAPAQPGALTPLARSLRVPAPMDDSDAQARMLDQNRAAVQALAREAGGPWEAQFDLSSGRVRRALGAGIPSYAGEANDLAARAEAPTLVEMEQIARAFIERHMGLFQVVQDELVVEALASRPLDDGRVRAVHFGRQVGGVKVDYAQVQLVFNRGNLTYVNVTNQDPVDVSPIPTLTPEAAWAAVVGEAALVQVQLAAAERVGKPALALVPVQEVENGPVHYRLVWRHKFRLPDGLETWQAGVDAHTGELVEFEDSNRYMCSLDPTKLQGQVRGGVRAAQATDPEEVWNFPYPLVVDNGVNQVADSNGYYFYSGFTASSAMQGAYFKANCTGCTPNPPLVTSSSDGLLDFGTGGVNQTSNGRSTPSDRCAFYHLNIARGIAEKWINVPWITANVGSNVNIASTCNAFWDGTSTNFFRSGGGCANTGEIRDVMQHEWGHGMDQNDGQAPRDSAMGEAYGDHIAIFVDHDSCVGQSFFGQSSGPYCTSIPLCGSTATCTGVRNVDEKRSTSGLMSIATAPANCGPSGCAGPLGLECHCEGEIYGQAAFHLANNFLTGNSYDTGSVLVPAGNPAYSNVAAWFIHERIFFNATALMASYAPSNRQTRGTGSYDAYIAVDDDNGNLADGTPNAAYINQAFTHHGMQEPTVRPDSANCVPPTDPTSTLTPLHDPTTGFAQVRVSWPDQNAAFYLVYRTQRLTDVWLPVRSQIVDNNSATYEIYDEPIQVGKTFFYVVVAVGSNGCPSPGADVKSIVVALPDAAAVVGVASDPGPGGDGDGIPEPGEIVRLRIDLSEVAGFVGLTNASIVLSTTDPLAQVIVPGPVVYGNVPAGGMVTGPAAFEVGISTAHPCGSVVPLIAAISADNGCFLRPVTLTIPTVGCAPAVRGEAVPGALALASDTGDPGCTDGDGFPDNGESVSYNVSIQNPGGAAANNISVLLASLNPKAAITSTNPVIVPTLAAGGSTFVSFTFVATGATCYEKADFTVTVDSDSNLFPVSKNGSVILEEDRIPTALNTGFETNFGGWTAVGFTRSTSRRNAGTWSAFAGPRPEGYPCDNSGTGGDDCSTLTTPPFVPGPFGGFSLFNWYRFEPFDGTQFWDRANVHVIENGVHTLIAPQSGKAYDGSQGDQSAFCHVADENGWAGSPAAGQVWGSSTFNLAPWNNREIQVEINYNSDSLAICEGMYVDDVSFVDTATRTCDTLVCGVACTPPSLGVAASGQTVCANGVASFTASISNPGSGGFTYEWDFGDGTAPLVVTDPAAPVAHRFTGLLPSYTVIFRALSQVAGACDAQSSVVVTIDNGTQPTGGPIGNRLRAAKQGAGAYFSWLGSGITPPSFELLRTYDRLELADTQAGIGDEVVVSRSTTESTLDSGALATGPSVGYFEVYPLDTCGVVLVR